MVSNVLYVDQKAYLFEGTIRDNILLEENYTDEEILQSLEQVGLSVRRTSLAIERKILDREDLTVIIVTHAPHPELKQYFTKIYQFPKDFI
ncbi:ABC transporter ATP-binding protein [Streptococcus pneumoniae]|nr:ABC transporter ATP-binding protein [Streptococcus pneumoniae]